MGKDFTPDDVRRQYVQGMPAGIGALFHSLWQDVTSLHLVWKTFLVLFGTSRERADLLTYCAKDFFLTLQWILWDDVLLRVARLTDPPQSAGRANASLRQLLVALTPHVPAELRGSLASEIESLEQSTASLRVQRHRRLAHTDLASALNPDEDVTPGVSRRDVETAMHAIGNIMNRVETHFLRSKTAYDQVIQTGDAESLMFWLQHARKHERCNEV